MDKLTAIKIKYKDGTYSDEIPVSVLAENVKWNNNNNLNLTEVLGNVKVTTAGTVQNQIDALANEKADVSDVTSLGTRMTNVETDVAVINTQVGALANGSPTPVATVAEMTDESAVYLYTGSEPNYTAGNWYYYNGTAWTAGGTYGGAVTDTTLSISGAAADAKAVGDALAEKADADDVGDLSQLTTTAKDNLVSAINEENEAVAGVNERLTQQAETIDDLTSGVIKDIPATFTEGKIYYSYKGNIFEGTNSNNEACVIDAKEGHYYIVYTGVPFNASYYGIVFTNDSGAVLGQYGQEMGSVSVAKLFSCIAPQGTTKAYVNNRNLSVDPFVKESLNVKSVNDLFDVSLNNSDLVKYLDFARRAVDQANTELGTYKGFIGSTGKINTTTYDVWKLYKYAVESGKVYKIIGDDVNIYYDTYAIATFSASDFDGTAQVTGTSIIIPAGHGATDTDYDVTFTAPSNGYVYISQYGNLNTCYLYETVVNSALINRLTNTKTKTVKMQIFSDSMSDDIWRETWNNFVADFIPQREWNIVNCAVGGSGIGHGKSVLPGGRYQDLEYNFVYDLITNPDVFETDNDIVVMLVGTNNFAYPAIGALGEWGDDTSSTFYGAAKLICKYVSEHTDALFIVCTPLPRYNKQDSERQVNSEGVPINQDGKTLRDYCDALVQTCHFFHIPVIDLNYEIGWNRYNISNFANDGLHPNERGAELVGAYISSVLKAHLGIS